MTNQRTLKTQVRNRMKRTGERYTTARAHVLAGRSTTADGHLPFVGGQQSDVAAATNLLNAAGVTGPDGLPLTEAQVFGLSGGVGFLYGVFRYDTGPTMTITARNASMPDTFLDQLWATEGLDLEVSTTGGVKKAAADLDAVLAGGRRALISVGAGAMGYLGLPLDESAMYPVAVGVVAKDGDEYLIDDRSPVPHRVDADTLKAARAVVRSAKHRLVDLRGAELLWGEVITAAITSGVERYNAPPVKQFAPNVGLAGLAKWQHLLTDRRDRMGWAKVFPEGATAAIGFSRIYECVEHAHTAPAASRPLQAEFLNWAAGVVGRNEFSKAATRFEESAHHWARVAELAASADPAASAAARLMDQRAELLDAGHEPGELTDTYLRQNKAIKTATITSERAAAVRVEIATEVAAIIEHERSALAILGSRDLDRRLHKRKAGSSADRITLLNPNTGRSDKTIALNLYNPVKKAILAALAAKEDLRFSDLYDEVENRTDPELWKKNKPGWYTVGVKLDLEARGLIERHGSPQRIRLTDAGRTEFEKVSN